MTYTTVKLGEVADFIRGITFKPDDVVPIDADDAVVCMRTKNVQAMLDCDDLIAVPSPFVRRKDQYLEEGDILVSSANSWNLVGKCCWIPSLPWRAAFGGFISVLRGNPKRVDRRYLYWWFASGRIQALLRSFGQKTTNISNLNIERCLQLDLPLPPLPEQRRIAAILDQADALRAKRREALAELDKLAQSIFVEMFGDPVSANNNWSLVRLADIAETITGYAFRSEEYVAHSKDSTKLCRGANVLPGRLDWSDLACWPNSKANEVASYKLEEGDIVIAMDRPWISEGFKISKITAVDCPSLLVQRVTRVRGITDVSNEYLYCLLNQPAFTNHCRPTETTVPHISPKDIRSFTFRLPPKQLRDSFVNRIRALNEVNSFQSTALAEQNALFASLQHRAFRGEL